LPYIDHEPYKLLRKTKDIYSIKQFDGLELPEKKRLLSWLEPPQVDRVIGVAGRIPRLEVTRAFLTVIGDRIITPLAIVTLVAKLRIVNPSDDAKGRVGKECAELDSLDENDPTQVEEFLNKLNSKKQTMGQAPEAICPQLASRKAAAWWVIFSTPKANRTVVQPVRINDLVSEKIVTLQFQAPPRVGETDFMLSVVSDSYVGVDKHVPLKLKLSSPTELPPEPVVEDDISEPEEDSIAGQMAQMRGQTFSSRVQNDDETSDEE
ncbi:secretory subunit, partial [Spiromyces aspiralis]